MPYIQKRDRAGLSRRLGDEPLSLFIYYILHGILNFLLYSIMAYVILGWLIAFNIINTRSSAVYQIRRVLEIIVDPLLEPFRRFLPLMGGLDLSPFLAGLIIAAVDRALLPKALVALSQLIG